MELEEIKEQLNKLQKEKQEAIEKRRISNKLQRERILKENPNYYKDKKKIFLEKNPNYNKEYQQRPEQIEYRRKWIENNRDRVNEYQRNLYKKNIENL